MGTIAVGTVAFSFFDADLSPTQALYFSIVTVTTVSYGDYTPQSDAARGFMALFALFGPVLLARALAAIATFPLERRRVLQQQRVLEQYGGELDANELEDLQKTLLESLSCATRWEALAPPAERVKSSHAQPATLLWLYICGRKSARQTTSRWS